MHKAARISHRKEYRCGVLTDFKCPMRYADDPSRVYFLYTAEPRFSVRYLSLVYCSSD